MLVLEDGLTVILYFFAEDSFVVGIEFYRLVGFFVDKWILLSEASNELILMSWSVLVDVCFICEESYKISNVIE